MEDTKDEQGIRRRGHQGEGRASPSNFETTSEASSPTETVRTAPKQSFQFRALLNKNASLQWKQKGTNICQILTPISCLLLILLIKTVAQAHLQGQQLLVDFPFLFNIPFWDLFDSKDSPIQLTTCLQWYYYDFDEKASQQTKDYIGYNKGLPINTPEQAGMLSNILTTPCRTHGRTVPYFKLPDPGKSINQMMFEELIELNKKPFVRSKDLAGLDILPDGAVTFYEANKDNLTMKIQINDIRIPEYHRTNAVTKLKFMNPTSNSTSTSNLRVTEGLLSLLDLVNRAYMRSINNRSWVVSGVQYMPQKVQDSSLLMRIISVAGASLFPISLSLMLPVFMYAIVLEKEERLQEMMKMNGMNMSQYWVVNYIFNFAIYAFMVILFYCFGRWVVDLGTFADTSPTIFLVVFVGWGLAQVSFSFFFQVFLSKARSATIVGYLLSMWTIIIGVSINLGLYPDPFELPWALRLYPTFGFCRLMYVLSMRCSADRCLRTFSALTVELKDCIIYLYLGAVVFLILGIYLNEVIPQEFGVHKHPLFFLEFLSRGRKKTAQQTFEAMQENEEEIPHEELKDEDDDARDERNRVEGLGKEIRRYPLICKNIRKVYPPQEGRPPKLAVRCFSLAIKQGEMFGLLGPNGAGKTSLISILTGLYEPDGGNAWVGGYGIREDIKQVHLQMGVCPQFDLLWPELTVEEHLLFYARIKGVPPEEEESKVDKALEEVYLTKFRNFQTRELSGGMRRRLSVAISLVGEPKIVFLDEPTTGLDPENRRQLWDILVEGRGKRAMVLTTHSMEEADVLCNRIGIITNGVLRCIGPQVRLKTLYGGGYHLYISCHKDKYLNESLKAYSNHEALIEAEALQASNQDEKSALSPAEIEEKVSTFVKSALPNSRMVSSFNCNFVFQIPLEGLEVSKVFDELEAHQEELGISDWGISQSSLEDVFMQIVRASEAKKNH